MESITPTAVIGFKGNVVMILHPDNRHLVYALGSAVVVRDVSEKTQTFLQGHDNQVSCLNVSPDGKVIASGQATYMGFPADVILWDFASRSISHRLTLHKVSVAALSFSHDSAFVATLGGQDDNTLVVWDVDKGTAVCGTPAAGDTACTVQFFTNSNRHLATGGHGHLRLWQVDIENKKLRPTAVNTGTLKRVTTALLMSADDKTVYCGNQTGDILEIDVERALYRKLGPPKQCFSQGITVMRLLPGGDLLVGTGSGLIARLQAGTLRPLRQCQVLGSVTSLALTNDGTHFFCGTALCNVYWVDVDSLTPELRNTCHAGAINAVCFPFGCSDVFATAAANDVRVWNAKTKQELLRIQVPNLECFCLTFARDGKSLLTGWSDGRVRAFLPQSGRLLFVINDAHRGGVTALAGNGESSRLVTGGMDGDVRVWKVSKNGQTMEASLKEHRGRVWGAKLKGDGSRAVTASADGSCIMWDLEHFTRTLCIFESTMFKAVAFHPDESQLITAGSDRKITFWDTFDGQAIRTLEGSQSAELAAIGMNQSGSHFVSGGGDALLRVWDYDEGLCKFVGKGHSGGITCVEFSPDQKTIVSVGTEGAIFVWQVPNTIQDK